MLELLALVGLVALLRKKFPPVLLLVAGGVLVFPVVLLANNPPWLFPGRRGWFAGVMVGLVTFPKVLVGFGALTLVVLALVVLELLFMNPPPDLGAYVLF